jgi:hypothetical protein
MNEIGHIYLQEIDDSVYHIHANVIIPIDVSCKHAASQTLETIYCNILFWHNQYILQYIVTILIYCNILVLFSWSIHLTCSIGSEIPYYGMHDWIF